MALALTLVAAAGCGGTEPAAAPAPTAAAPGSAPASTVTAAAGLGAAALTEETFRALLTLEDVRAVAGSQLSVETRLLDYKEMAEGVDPAQAVNIDSFYGLGFETEDGGSGITLSVIDSDSEASAQARFEEMSTGPLVDMGVPIGDASAEVELNAQGIGGMIVFVKGDKAVSLHTAQPEGQPPLVPLAGLEGLATLVAGRL